LCGCQVAFEQRRRQFARADVVEAMTDVIFGKERRGVDLEVQQIADGVVILGAVEPAERIGAPGIRMRSRCLVERCLQRRDEGLVRGLVRPRPPTPSSAG